MRQQKKNGFFTFIFSFMPGAAEMYMGFLKQGFSLMAIFLLSFALPNFLGLYDFNFVSVILVWFFGFFHARHLATLRNEIFYELKDGFIWEELLPNETVRTTGRTFRKWVATILVAVGAIVLWKNVSSMVYNFIPEKIWQQVYPVVEKVPQVVIAIIIIAIGIKLIAGKREELKKDGE